MERPPKLDAELVGKVVLDAHRDLESVKLLLAQEPMLLNAAWDWGGGDWERALGSAAHVGRRDIAEFLLTQGAHLDIFAAAMLGELDIVQTMIAKYPQMVHAKGPHGIPLLVHAKAGGEKAAPVLAFLEARMAEE